MNDDLVEIFKNFITTPDKNKANDYFNLLVAHFADYNKDTTHFVKLKNDFFNYGRLEIIGIRSALKVEFENLSGLKVH